jgi:hypothetical protein
MEQSVDVCGGLLQLVHCSTAVEPNVDDRFALKASMLDPLSRLRHLVDVGRVFAGPDQLAGPSMLSRRDRQASCLSRRMSFFDSRESRRWT